MPNIIYPDLSYEIMAAIFEVHKVLGPGFLESIYEKALIKEPESRGIKVETQKVIDLMYKDRKIGTHRLDLVVDNKVVLN
jgi:GxxExxY protein